MVPNPLPAGLAAGWTFDEPAGISADDSSGNGNTATLVNGVARGTGAYGGGLVFDGVNDYPDRAQFDVAQHLGNRSDTDHVDQAAGRRRGRLRRLGKFWNATMTSPFYQYGLELSGGTVPTFYVGTAGGPRSASMGSALTLNQWSHLAVVFDGSQARFYVNGGLTSTAPLAATLTARGTPLRVGADINTQQFFKGSLDEVRVYDRALTASEVQTDLSRQP